MQLKIDKLKQLMDQKFSGNYHAFARELKIDVSTLHKILNVQINAGLKTINKIIEYLKSQDLEVEEYIFLP